MCSSALLDINFSLQHLFQVNFLTAPIQGGTWMTIKINIHVHMPQQ